jgi:Flp pilus assembly protein TadD
MDQLTRSLADMRQFQDELNVIPVESVRGERVTDPHGAMIAFGANLAVNGTVDSEDGGALRILLELVDTRAGRAIRQRTVPWVVGHGVTLQHRLVDALSEMLEFELEEPTRTAIATGGTVDREAQTLFSQALGMMELDPSDSSLQDATDLLRRALDYDPGFTLARAELAEACRRRFGLTGEEVWSRAALTYARQAVEENGRLPRAHVVLGRVLAEQGMIGEGLAQVAIALELDPLNATAIRAKADILSGSGDRAGARSSFEEALALRPEDWAIVYNAGVFYYEELDFDTAVHYFRRMVELRPETAWAWSALGGALFMQGEWSEARTALNRSLAIGPTYEALSNLGTLEFYEGRYGKAVPLFEDALEIQDEDWRVWNNLAEAIRFGGGDPMRMGETYRRALELAERDLEERSGDDDLRLTIASLRAATGDEAEARAIVDEFSTAQIIDPNLMLVIASIEEDLGERARALEWLGLAIAGGYPLAEIERYPGFADLTADPGFDELRRGRADEVSAERMNE